ALERWSGHDVGWRRCKTLEGQGENKVLIHHSPFTIRRSGVGIAKHWKNKGIAMIPMPHAPCTRHMALTQSNNILGSD
ncbi:MAG: hypothetical protein KDD73_14005, partial [Anaerolineales bacterium]|nr:hypothetical protein [Anaerolineales bacterium]